MAQDLVLILGITLLCMLSPGPDMVLVMQSTLAGDRRQGLLTSLSVLTGNLVHIAYCALGLGYVVAHSIVAYSSLKFAGAAYLIFLGLSGLRGAVRGTAREPTLAPEPQPRKRARALSAYARGLLNNLLNPKGALFYLGVFSQVIKPGTPSVRAAVLVLAMLATSATFWVVFVYTLHRPVVRRVLARSRRTVDAVFGALLVMLGLRVASQD
jgi:threonine/homoserine/homoserine lactone efflux protein